MDGDKGHRVDLVERRLAEVREIEKGRERLNIRRCNRVAVGRDEGVVAIALGPEILRDLVAPEDCATGAGGNSA